MNYFYKIGPSSINYDSINKTIILRDEHSRVDLAQAPFERIIQAWKDGKPTCWNARGCAPGWRLYDEGIIVEYYDEDLLTDIWLPEDDFEEIIQAYERFCGDKFANYPLDKVYGKMLPNGDFQWGDGSYIGTCDTPCPRYVMETLYASFHQEEVPTMLTVDDWHVYCPHPYRVQFTYKEDFACRCSMEVFMASLNYWRKETQN